MGDKAKLAKDDKRADKFVAAFEAMGYPPREVEESLFRLGETELPEDDTDALNMVLNQVGHASVGPEVSADYLAGKVPEPPEEEEEEEAEAKAEKKEKAGGKN